MANGAILIVEDDGPLREALCETLELAGYPVHSAIDGKNALEVLDKEDNVSMVVSDVQMEPMDGHSLLKALHTQKPELPVVLMTAYGTIQKAVHAMRDGAVDYLVKPFEAEALVAEGFSAVKLVPVLMWVKQFPDQTYAVSTYTLSYWYQIFLGRHLHGAYALINQGGGWHEYGAYLGPVVLALALLGLTGWRRRLVRGLVIAVVALVLLSSAGPYFAPVLDELPWIPRSYTSRAVVLAVVPVILMAGVGLDVLRRWNDGAGVKLLRLLLVGVVAVDLMSLAYPLSGQAFVLPVVERPLPAAGDSHHRARSPCTQPGSRETARNALGRDGEIWYDASGRGYMQRDQRGGMWAFESTRPG